MRGEPGISVKAVGDGITLREAREADLDDIRTLHTESWRSAYAPFVPNAALQDLPKEMAARWAELPSGVICAHDGGRMVGFVRLKTRQGWPYIDNLHALPERRGEGIGAVLIQAAGERLQADGSGRVWLTVIAGNMGARRFYARHGGVEAGQGIEPVLGHPTPVLAVVWNRLGPLVPKIGELRPEPA